VLPTSLPSTRRWCRMLRAPLWLADLVVVVVMMFVLYIWDLCFDHKLIV
jgi:hypothetical protein